MTLDDIPLFSMLKGKLNYLSDRQQLIGQNVANSDTPGYTPRDLQPFKLPNASGPSAPLDLAPVQTSAAHMSGTRPRPTAWKAKDSPDSETRLDGNKVVLEDEMMKMQDARLNYETALGLYQKSMAMIQMAIKAPGKP